jgi:hypothetical protein
MDPNATLKRWRDAVKDGDNDEVADAVEDLRNWIRRGGFKPIGMTRAEKTILGIKPVRRAKTNPCKGGCAPMVTNPRKCRGKGPEKARVIRCKGKRNPENPNFHYPKTKRGRPPVPRGWHMEILGAQDAVIGRKTLRVPQAEAHKAARALVGKRFKGKHVVKVVLNGPK